MPGVACPKASLIGMQGESRYWRYQPPPGQQGPSAQGEAAIQAGPVTEVLKGR